MGKENKVTFDNMKKILIEAADKMLENREYFNDLDAPLGDSDHGDSIFSSFKEVKSTVLDTSGQDKDIGKLLQDIGRAIMFSGGGAMGPLYGSAFFEAGKALDGKNELSFADLVDLWDAFLAAIAKQGAKVGEKTMYDTIYPSVEALRSAHSDKSTLSEACLIVDKAAKEGMESTKDMLALRGRSSRLGERTIGHIDPGAASMYTLVSTFFQTLKKQID